jgi:hypothetical protein
MFPREDPNAPIQLGLNRRASNADPDVPAAESLQFRKAETNVEKVSCAFCKQPLGDTCYHVGDRTACPRCAQSLTASQARRGGMREFVTAALYGFGAALAGSALFAVVALVAHLRLGLLAIVVGVMVGKAVVYGAGGCRGRRFQILAVLLTYFSISSSYVPLFIAELREHRAAKIAATGGAAGSPRTVTPVASAAGVAIALVILTGLSLAAPFFELASGIGGLIGLFIVFIGLRQAWHYTRAIKIPILGPFTVGGIG